MEISDSEADNEQRHVKTEEITIRSSEKKLDPNCDGKNRIKFRSASSPRHQSTPTTQQDSKTTNYQQQQRQQQQKQQSSDTPSSNVQLEPYESIEPTTTRRRKRQISLDSNASLDEFGRVKRKKQPNEYCSDSDYKLDPLDRDDLLYDIDVYADGFLYGTPHSRSVSPPIR
jgi:hypothetical protein